MLNLALDDSPATPPLTEDFNRGNAESVSSHYHATRYSSMDRAHNADAKEYNANFNDSATHTSAWSEIQ